MQEADPLSFQLFPHDIDARDVSPRPVVTLNKAELYGIAHGKDDRDRRGCCLCRQSRGLTTDGREDAYRLADQLRGKTRQPLVIAARPTELDRQVLAFGITHFGEALAKAGHLGRRVLG